MKNIIKARIVPLFGVMALVAVIGFSMIACDDGSGNGENGGNGGGDGLSRDSRLVGKWQSTYNSTLFYTFNADGSTISNFPTSTYTWSTSGNTLTTVMKTTGLSITYEIDVTYDISEDGQTLTTTGGSAFAYIVSAGTYKKVDED